MRQAAEHSRKLDGREDQDYLAAAEETQRRADLVRKVAINGERKADGTSG